MWVMSGSQDGTILFVDHRAGVLIGVLDLEAEFYATAAVWRSDTILIFGCSNGVVYHLDFKHMSRCPVSVHALVKPLKSPVRALAFDTYRNMLAIACGGEVGIYVRADGTGTESWGCVDHILAPCAGPPGLVTALCFFGTALSRRHLFITHAKASWTTTIPPSERFIAIATLDNSIVTYSLGEGGPDIATHFEAKSQELTNYRPVLPIVSTSSSLVLKGTAISDIDVLDTRTHATTSFHHAHNHIIRTLNAYGDKLVVSSSDLTENRTTSCLRCYTFSNTAEPRDWCRIDEFHAPIFEITLSSILPFTEWITLYNPLGKFSIGWTVWLKFQQRRGLLFLLVGLSVLLLALTLDKPSRVMSISIRDVWTTPPPTSQSTASS
ncbi:hypothetical protein FRC11_008204 [Ceratobasidium sp. 423]|nr:hypothetical protein FRC11_008204 [Ceratobasidium sp. 423]